MKVRTKGDKVGRGKCVGGVIRAGGRAKVSGGGSDEVGEEVRDPKGGVGGEGEREGRKEGREGGGDEDEKRRRREEDGRTATSFSTFVLHHLFRMCWSS